MQVVNLPDRETHAWFEVLPDERPLNDDEFLEFCMSNPDLRIEREAGGEIIIMPPAGGETGSRNSDLNFQLTMWAKRDGRGRAFDSSTGYLLPNGAILSPDASWMTHSRLQSLTKRQKRNFLPLCPDFVIELPSPSDRLNKLKAKMRQWIENGAQLAWLIDADRRAVSIYRPGQEPEERHDQDHILGEGPIAGFRLELIDIWQGL